MAPKMKIEQLRLKSFVTLAPEKAATHRGGGTTVDGPTNNLGDCYTEITAPSRCGSGK